jgi:hypothetical protein
VRRGTKSKMGFRVLVYMVATAAWAGWGRSGGDVGLSAYGQVFLFSETSLTS